MTNESEVFRFFLVGFPGLHDKFNAVLSVTFFCVYNISFCANTIVVAVIVLKNHLHHPMYIIIASLAIADFLFDSATMPKIIARYWVGDGSIPLTACLLQMFIVHTLNSVDSLTFTLMAIDRLFAICKPLHYSSIITNQRTTASCLLAWAIGAAAGLTLMTWAIPLPFCGPNRVKTFYCSIGQVSYLACADTSQIRKNGFYFGILMHVGPMPVIACSYVIIIINVCAKNHLGNWHKLLHTCITHWFAMVLFFLPRIVDYGLQTQVINDADLMALVICLYSYVPRMCNPIIFCLRTAEIKRTLRHITKRKTWLGKTDV
ncbi:olfactory receptor 6B1-like [Hyperolius riggenbachi]|uniref:olfactory receptor 6B1-like n=1 Tax=Hyperolius riggenbachi TaxID=752182 RepID=UPI0035A3C825